MKYSVEKKLINREFGRGVGRDAFISSKSQKSITDVMPRKDHINDGITMVEYVYLILEVITQLFQEQAQQSFVQECRQKHSIISFFNDGGVEHNNQIIRNHHSSTVPL